MGPTDLSVESTQGFASKNSSYIATSNILVGVLVHLLFEQLVRRVLSYHGRHDGDVVMGCLFVGERLEIRDLSRAKYGPDGLIY
jgi:hypothetical protein